MRSYLDIIRSHPFYRPYRGSKCAISAITPEKVPDREPTAQQQGEIDRLIHAGMSPELARAEVLGSDQDLDALILLREEDVFALARAYFDLPAPAPEAEPEPDPAEQLDMDDDKTGDEA